MISAVTTAIFLSFFASAILLNYRVGRILNLSFSSLFTLGAYMHLHECSLIIAFFAGLVIGSILAVITEKLTVGEATIVSLGFAIAIEEFLRIMFRTSYYQIIETQYVNLFNNPIDVHEMYASLLFIALLLIFTTIFLSSHGIRLRFVEDDYELAEMYGVDSRRIRLLSISISSGFVCISGSILAPVHTIFPSMGWSVLAISVIIAALAASTGNAGLRKYLATLPIALLYTSIIYLRWSI